MTILFYQSPGMITGPHYFELNVGNFEFDDKKHREVVRKSAIDLYDSLFGERCQAFFDDEIGT